MLRGTSRLTSGRIDCCSGFGFVMVLIFGVAYAIGSANNLALLLDDQENDRYLTLTFWRLAAPALDLFGMYFFMLFLAFNDNDCARYLACMMLLLTILVQAASLAWFVVDVFDCTNQPHCDGPGPSILGVDIAFVVLLISLVVRLFCTFVVLFVSCCITGAVSDEHTIGYLVSPNGNPTPRNTQAFIERSLAVNSMDVGTELGSSSSRGQITRRAVTYTDDDDVY